MENIPSLVQRGDVPQRSPFSDRREKFSVLKGEVVSKGVLAKIRSLFGYIGTKLGLFNWEVHFSAEHMSQGAFSGNFSSSAIGSTIDLLNKMTSPPEQLVKALTYALSISKKKEIYPSALLAHAVKKDVLALDVGQSLAIPTDVQGHSMIMMVTCTRKDSGGKKTYSIVQHNTGDGIGTYHYQKKDNGKMKFQTALEITDISQESLCGEQSKFFSRLFSLVNLLGGKGVDALYNDVFPLLKGTISGRSYDERLWSHGQLGGSCTTSCLVSLVRSQVDKSTFQQFREVGRLEILLKSVHRIKAGWWRSKEHMNVVIETINKLESSYKKRKIPFPDSLREIRDNVKEELSMSSDISGGSSLGGSQKVHRVSTPIKFMTSAWELQAKNPDAIKGLTEIVTHLKSGKCDRNFIETRCNQIAGITFYGDEKKKFLELCLEIVNFCKDRPLTKDQVLIMTGITSTIFQNIQSVYWKEKGKVSKVYTFCVEMHVRFNAMGLSCEGKGTKVCEAIEKVQKSLLGRFSIEPEGLRRIKKKMKTILS